MILGAITAKVWMYLTYWLEDLQWKPEDFGNISSVVVPPHSIWTPDVMFYDTAEVIYDGFKEQQIEHFGFVIAKSAGMTVKLTCVFDVRLFPFDTQVSMSQFVQL